MTSTRIAPVEGDAPQRGPRPMPTRQADGPAPPIATVAHQATRRAAATAPRPCTIRSVVVRGSGNRPCGGPNRVLQVVAGAGNQVQVSYTYGPVQLSGTSSSGGEAEITAEAICGAAGRKQTALGEVGSDAPPSRWDTGATKTYQIPAPENQESWTKDAEPEVRQVFGRGCDDATQSVRVESFPSQQQELSLNVALFQDLLEEVNDSLERAFNRSFAGIRVVPSIVGPTGTLTCRWGWKENTDWRAYFECEVEAGLNPAFGVGVEFRVSLLELGGTSALTAIGVPPPAAQWIAAQAAEYIADLFVFANLQLTYGIVGSGAVRFFATGSRGGRLRIAPNATGTIAVGLAARVGNAFLSCEIRGQVETGLSLTGELSYETGGGRDGLFFNPSIGWPGITVSVTIVFRAGFIEPPEGPGFRWTPVNAATLWQPREPYQLAGRPAGS